MLKPESPGSGQEILMTPKTLMLAVLATSFLAMGALGPAMASPADAKVGDTRAVYADTTTLRASNADMSQAVATLTKGTRVRVLEKKQNWLRVQVQASGNAIGWVHAYRTTEPAALQPNPTNDIAYRGTGGVSRSDVSTAGRQLDAETERGFIRSRQDLRQAYGMVDAMENATKMMDPSASIAFIINGRLGRMGQDHVRPANLPFNPNSVASSGRSSSSGRRGPLRGRLGGILGGVGREVARRGGVDPRIADVAVAMAQRATELRSQVAKEFTPEHRYYLGRAVAAMAIAKYGIDPNARRRAYVRSIGDAIVRLSPSLRSTVGGYHFDVLNTDTVNAIAGPGGYVLVTRGAVMAAKTEDELAGVIAHELAHIKNRDGEVTLRRSPRWSNVLSVIGAGAGQLTDDRLAGQLVDFFSKSVGEMGKTAMDNSYSRAQEFQADTDGSAMLREIYYDHGGLRDFLQRYAQTNQSYGDAAHASPAVRAGALSNAIAPYGPYQASEATLNARLSRFQISAIR